MPNNMTHGLLAVGLIGAALSVWLVGDFTVIKFNEIVATEIPKALLALIFVALLIERATEVYVNMESKPSRPGSAARKLLLAEAELARTRNELVQAQDAAVAAGAMTKLLKKFDEAQAAHSVALKDAAPDEELESNDRRKRTTMLGMVLGLVAAMVGARALGPFVDLDQFKDCARVTIDTGAQKVIFDNVEQALKDMKDAIEPAKTALATMFAQQKCVIWEGQRAWFAGVDVLITGAVLAGGADGIHQIVNRFLEFAGKKP